MDVHKQTKYGILFFLRHHSKKGEAYLNGTKHNLHFKTQERLNFDFVYNRWEL